MRMKGFKTYMFVFANLILLVLAYFIFKNAGQAHALLEQQADNTLVMPLVKNFMFLVVPALVIPFVVFLILLIIELTQNVGKLNVIQLEKAQIDDYQSMQDEENSKLLEEQRLKEREQACEFILKALTEGCQEIERKKLTEPEDIGSAILSLISKSYDIVQGEIYLAHTNAASEPKLKLLTTYAYYIPEGKITEFEMGEGLIGQVAQAQTALNLDTIPEGYILIASGLGKATPSNLLITPVLSYQGKLVGIIELATFKPFDQFDVNVFTKVGEFFAKLFDQEAAKISD